MTDATTEAAAAPRTISLRSALTAGWGWGLLGVAGVAAGAWWWAAGGADADALRVDAAEGIDTTALGLALLPGVACLLVWLRIAWHAKILLATGRIAPHEFGFAQRLYVPGQILVGYRYRDERGGTHEARQWVPAWTREAHCVLRGGRGFAVVHDPAQPGHARLVAAERLAHEPAS